MNYVIFENNGVVDKRAITVMGVSSKEEGSIGYFGTGLKYAIATLLRNGMEVTIHAGTETLEFKTKEERIRNDSFNIITMNGVELGFTTSLGRDWLMWQAFRELYCNCLDEGGDIYEGDYKLAEEGMTIICVKGDLICEQFRNRNAIFIGENDNYVFKSDKCEVYEGKGVFYRKVKVKEKCNTLYRYNVLQKIDLTEDRTVKYDFEVAQAICDTVVQSDNEYFVERMITCNEDNLFENNISYNSGCVPSETFLNTVAKVRKNRRADLKDSAWKLYLKHTQKSEYDDPVILTDFEKKQLFKAKELCEKLGFDVSKFNIETHESLGDGVLALAQRSPEKKILLTKGLYTKGVLNLARGLIEEYIHLQHGYNDCTRDMQNYLFDQMVHFGMVSIKEVA